jgi:hypothetical protein
MLSRNLDKKCNMQCTGSECWLCGRRVGELNALNIDVWSKEHWEWNEKRDSNRVYNFLVKKPREKAKYKRKLLGGFRGDKENVVDLVREVYLMDILPRRIVRDAWGRFELLGSYEGCMYGYNELRMLI